MDVEMRSLIEKRLQSPLKIEVVHFFAISLAPLCTRAGLSMWLGVSADALDPVLTDLSRDNLLQRSGDGDAAVFTLSAEARRSETLTRLLDLYDDDTQREEVLALMRR